MPTSPSVPRASAPAIELIRRQVGWRGWAVSLVAHVVALSALSTVCWWFTIETITPPLGAGRVPRSPAPPRQTLHESDQAPIERPLADDPQAVIDPFALDEPANESESDDQLPLGRLDAVHDLEVGGPGAFLAIGAGTSASGLFGQRDARGRRRAIMRGDASDASESAVEAALRWFKRHQGADGWWDGYGHLTTCPNRHGKPSYLTGAPNQHEAIAYTALALLCFQGAGYDQVRSGPYTDTIVRGLRALRSAQLADGTFPGNNYTRALAAMTLVEAYANGHDQELADPAARAIHAVLAQQNHMFGERSGWDYEGPSERDDTSITGWNVMALTCADAAGIKVDAGLRGAGDWLRHGLLHMDDHFHYSGGRQTDEGRASLDGVAVSCAAFLGGRRDERMISKLADSIAASRPTTYPCCTYSLYNDTVALFHVGDERWPAWIRGVRDLLVQAQQRDDGCLSGSWPAGNGIGEIPFVSTALCCLTLEAPYRYATSHRRHPRPDRQRSP